MVKVTRCLACRNTRRANMNYLLDVHELVEHVRGFPGQPITTRTWASLCRGGKADGREALRRAWERFKRWLSDHGAPVHYEDDEQGTGHKPLHLGRGIGEWLRGQEVLWGEG